MSAVAPRALSPLMLSHDIAARVAINPVGARSHWIEVGIDRNIVMVAIVMIVLGPRAPGPMSGETLPALESAQLPSLVPSPWHAIVPRRKTGNRQRAASHAVDAVSPVVALGPIPIPIPIRQTTRTITRTGITGWHRLVRQVQQLPVWPSTLAASPDPERNVLTAVSDEGFRWPPLALAALLWLGCTRSTRKSVRTRNANILGRRIAEPAVEDCRRRLSTHRTIIIILLSTVTIRSIAAVRSAITTRNQQTIPGENIAVAVGEAAKADAEARLQAHPTPTIGEEAVGVRRMAVEVV